MFFLVYVQYDSCRKIKANLFKTRKSREQPSINRINRCIAWFKTVPKDPRNKYK